MATFVCVRVSTEDQVEFSPDAQAKRCKDLARLRDLGPVTVLADEGWSGKNLERPKMRELLDLVRAGAVHGLVARSRPIAFTFASPRPSGSTRPPSSLPPPKGLLRLLVTSLLRGAPAWSAPRSLDPMRSPLVQSYGVRTKRNTFVSDRKCKPEIHQGQRCTFDNNEWALRDSNPRPAECKSAALTN